jgi:hypothetical protein
LNKAIIPGDYFYKSILLILSHPEMIAPHEFLCLPALILNGGEKGSLVIYRVPGLALSEPVSGAGQGIFLKALVEEGGLELYRLRLPPQEPDLSPVQLFVVAVAGSTGVEAVGEADKTVIPDGKTIHMFAVETELPDLVWVLYHDEAEHFVEEERDVGIQDAVIEDRPLDHRIDEIGMPLFYLVGIVDVFGAAVKVGSGRNITMILLQGQRRGGIQDQAVLLGGLGVQDRTGKDIAKQCDANSFGLETHERGLMP